MIKCQDCKTEYINFYSEGETYEITQDMNGNIGYICEDCLNKIRRFVK